MLFNEIYVENKTLKMYYYLIWINFLGNPKTKKNVLSARAVEYTDCTSAER